MTDTPARLRALIHNDLASGYWDSPDGRLIAEAAAEIERLEAKAAQLASTLATRMLDTSKDKEIERLREALESLTKDPASTLDEPDTDAEVIIKMRAIALAAIDAASKG